MNNNNLGSQWLSTSTSSNNTSFFLNSNQSPSSIVGFNDNNDSGNASNHSPSNMSMFNPMKN